MRLARAGGLPLRARRIGGGPPAPWAPDSPRAPVTGQGGRGSGPDVCARRGQPVRPRPVACWTVPGPAARSPLRIERWEVGRVERPKGRRFQGRLPVKGTVENNRLVPGLENLTWRNSGFDPEVRHKHMSVQSFGSRVTLGTTAVDERNCD